MITNRETGTQVDEVARGIYRISTPLDVIPGGFTFNSYLVDDEPVLFIDLTRTRAVPHGVPEAVPVYPGSYPESDAGRAKTPLDRWIAL